MRATRSLDEASIEQFFVNRLLPDLGYRDSQIKPKTTLQKLAVSLGRMKVNYRPDYALVVRRKPRWVLDARGVNESLDDFVGQCAGYCLQLNRGYEDENPVRYFVLTNGKTTRVYEWDREDFILELDFDDFVEGNERYRQLRDLLKQDRFSKPAGAVAKEGPTLTLRRRSLDDINATFAWCHQFIYRKEQSVTGGRVYGVRQDCLF